MRRIAEICLCLSLTLSSAGALAADGQPEIIKSYRRPTVLVREGLTQPAVRRNSSDLPTPAEVTGTEGDFVRFKEPVTGRSWLVSRVDVVIDGPPALVAGHNIPCLKVGSMGMGKRC